MAYNNWGAFVYCNGRRRTDREDVGVYDVDESNLSSGIRILANILKNEFNSSNDLSNYSHHAVLGDGNVRLCGYKNNPVLWRFVGGKAERIDLNPYKINQKSEYVFDYNGTIDGYNFRAYQYSENTVDLWLKEPNGNQWTSTCGYGYGAGHMDCFEDDLKTITNADLIREMDNEELAGVLVCPKEMEWNGGLRCEFDIHGDCRKCVSDWLNQEVDEE